MSSHTWTSVKLCPVRLSMVTMLSLAEWVEASAGSAATPPLSSFLGALLGGALWLEDLPRVPASPCRRERQQAPQALVGIVF